MVRALACTARVVSTGASSFDGHREQTFLLDTSLRLSPVPASVRQTYCPKWVLYRKPYRSRKSPVSPSRKRNQQQQGSQSSTLSTREYIYIICPVAAFLHVRRYTDNGGSTLGITGADFAILAGDTRHTTGYSINTRYYPKLFKIGGTGADGKGAKIVLSVVGFAMSKSRASAV